MTTEYYLLRIEHTMEKLLKITVFILAIFVLLVSGSNFYYKSVYPKKTIMYFWAGCEKNSSIIKSPALSRFQYSDGSMRPSTELEGYKQAWMSTKQRYDFTYDDVARYMMKHCPPRNDAEIEVAYDNYLTSDADTLAKRLIFIEYEKDIRDYQLKFINKDLDVFHK